MKIRVTVFVLIAFFFILSCGYSENYIIVLKNNSGINNQESVDVDEDSIINSVDNNGTGLINKIENLANCEENGLIKYDKLWIANSISLNASPEVIEQLRDNEEIEGIFEDFQMQIEPQDENVIEKFDLADVEDENDLLETVPLAHWGVKHIKAPQVWMKYKARGQGVRIGVVDTGINHTHEAIKGRLLRYRNFYNNNQVPHDDNGHGSHVAGIIAGSRSMGKFIGVAPESKLIVAKVTDPQGRMMYSTFMKALQWMTDPDKNPKTNDRPVAVNCSLHFPTIKSQEAVKHFNGLCLNLLKFNIVPVFGAGNDFTKKNLPIFLLNNSPHIITVGALGINGKRASFSRIGKAGVRKPDMAGPGDRIPSCDHVANRGLIVKMGTSMAAPHVTGVIALMKSVNPKLNCRQIMWILKTSCVDVGPKGFDIHTGFGCINAEIAVKKALALRSK
ncbi:S8 family serine peptidase [bacterium]|nr:S8 family serine peptidase [bacterium]